jgi:hypothetical protein
MQRWFLMQASRPNGRHEKPWIKRAVVTEVSEPLPLLFYNDCTKITKVNAAAFFLRSIIKGAAFLLFFWMINHSNQSWHQQHTLSRDRRQSQRN